MTIEMNSGPTLRSPSCDSPSPPARCDVMLISPTRIVLRTVVDRPAALRNFGATTIYVAMNGALSITLADGPSQHCEMAVVPPNLMHRVSTADADLTKILVETESSEFTAIHDCLQGSTDATRNTVRHMREAFDALPGISTPEIDVDRTFFGVTLPRREMDRRIARVIDTLATDTGEKPSVGSCAAMMGVSSSRFTHLFHQETGQSFRAFKTWKVARAFLPLMSGSFNLADIAYQLGYADSPHFSRSIRKVYGIPPSSMCDNARRVRVLVSNRHPICDSGLAMRNGVSAA